MKMAVTKLKCVASVLILLVAISYGTSAVSGATVKSSPENWTMFRQSPNHVGALSGNSTVNSAQLLWNFSTMMAVVSSPAVVNGYVYFGENQGAIYCVNAANGKLVWYHSTDAEVRSSPAVYDGCVYFTAYDGNVYALNASSGGQIWNYTIGSVVDPGPSGVSSSPAIVSGVLYVGSFDGNVYALNATDGTELWSYSTGSDVFSSPAVCGGVVYAASNFVVYAINATSGRLIWSQHTGTTISSPVVSGGFLYVGSYDGYVCSLNASNGAFVWKFQTSDAVLSSPAIAYGYIYFGSEDDNVYCLNASSGKEIWRSPTGYWVLSSPAVADGNVYVGSEDNDIYCFNAYTGVKQWSYRTGDYVDSSPAIYNDTLYVGSDDNHLYAFSLTNSTPENMPDQPETPLPWTTVVFDAVAVVVAVVAVFALARYARLSRHNKKTAESKAVADRKKWFAAHSEALSIIAIIAFSSVFFVGLGNGGLWVADEQTYSQWAYHMVSSGDYLTPWGGGGLLLWISKPPLYMWLMALSYQFLGVSNFSSRLPSAVFGCLTLVLVYFLGKKLYNKNVGFLSALILGSFTTFYDFARRAMTDVLLVFCIVASVYFFVASENEEDATKYAALSGLFFGLALMTKQLEALLIPMIIFVYLLMTSRSSKFLFTKRFTLLWSVALLVFAPWLIYMAATYGQQFWQAYIGFSVVSRTIMPIEGHSHGIFYYFTSFATTENIAYVILTPLAAALCIFRASAKRAKPDALLVLWMIVVLALFTAAQTKLYYYILPAFPAFAIAISSLIYTIARKGWSLISRSKTNCK